MKKMIAMLLAVVMIFTMVACTSNKAQENPAEDSAKVEETAKTEEPVEAEQPKGVEVEAKIEENKKYKEHVNMSVWSALTTVDPVVYNGGAAGPMYNNWLNQLVCLDEDNNVFEPELAESWEVVDLRTYKFKLKEGILFHNGEALKASDVKFSLVDRANSLEGVSRPVITEVDSVEVVDDYNLIIHLNVDDPEYLYLLSNYEAAIFNEKACNEDENGYLIGTGGFKVTEWVPTDKMSFEKFDESWVWAEEGDTPTRTITMKCMTEGSIAACQAGDVANALCEMADIDGYLKDDPNVETYTFYTWGVWALAFNQNAASVFADDPNLQKACVAAFDRQTMAEFYAGDKAKTFDSFFPDYMYGYTNTYEFAKYDVDRAKEYLAASKYSDGNVTIRVLTNSNPNYTAQATVLQSVLEANLGVKIDIQQLDGAGRAAAIAEGTSYDIYMYDFTAGPNGSKLSSMFNIGTNANTAWYDNPEAVQMYVDYAATTDETVQKEKLARVQEIVAEEVPYVPYAYQVCNVVMAKGVSGIHWKTSTAFDFHRVVWEEE